MRIAESAFADFKQSFIEGNTVQLASVKSIGSNPGYTRGNRQTIPRHWREEEQLAPVLAVDHGIAAAVDTVVRADMKTAQIAARKSTGFDVCYR